MSGLGPPGPTHHSYSLSSSNAVSVASVMPILYGHASGYDTNFPNSARFRNFSCVCGSYSICLPLFTIPTRTWSDKAGLLPRNTTKNCRDRAVASVLYCGLPRIAPVRAAICWIAVAILPPFVATCVLAVCSVPVRTLFRNADTALTQLPLHPDGLNGARAARMPAPATWHAPGPTRCTILVPTPASAPARAAFFAIPA